MLPFQGLAAYVPILKGICIVFGKTTQKRCVSRTLPISMMPLQWEVDYAWRLFCLLVLHRIPVELCNVLTDTTFRVCILSFFEACLQLFSIVSAAKLQLFSNKSKFFLQLFANSFALNRMFFVKFGGKTFVF